MTPYALANKTIELQMTHQSAQKLRELEHLQALVWDPRLDELMIEYIPADVAPGQWYWRLTRGEFWGEEENQGKHRAEFADPRCSERAARQSAFCQRHPYPQSQLLWSLSHLTATSRE
jgi:hypothetical protein